MKKFLILKFIGVFTILIFNYSLTNAQQLKWVLPNYQWDMQASPTSATLPGSSYSDFYQSNGAHDDSGNLKFYVTNNTIYDSKGNYVEYLLPYYVDGAAYTPDGSGGEHTRNFELPGEEIAIAPVPGACQKYYVIYSMTNHFTLRRYVLYAVVDCGGPVSVNYPIANNPGVSNYPINENVSGSEFFGTGLAVSKIYEENNRYLFIGGFDGIARYEILNTGIDNETIISDNSDEPTLFPTTGSGYYSNQELELSPDQRFLAWGNTLSENLNVMPLNSSYTKGSGSFVKNIPNIRGVEFNATSSRIYVSEPVKGVKYYDFGTDFVDNVSTSNLLSNTFLELASNGLIYGVNSNHKLQAINEASNVLYSEILGSILVNSYGTHPFGISGRHHLPDQVDGQAYYNFSGDGVPAAYFKINGSNVSSICANPSEVFNCTSFPMALTNLSINSYAYRFVIQNITTCLSTPITVHDTGILSAFPTDLKNLPGGSSGTYLSNNNGNYKITFFAYNLCGKFKTQTAYISVASSPTGANATFITKTKTKPSQTLTIGSCSIPAGREFYYIDGPEVCSPTLGYYFQMEHNSNLLANQVGRTSTSFDLSGVSPGTGSNNFQVNIKMENWDGTNWLSMDSNPNGETITGASDINLTELVSYDTDSPWYGAFLDPLITPDGSIYRITITVSNECDSYANSQVFKLNTVKLRSGIVSNQNSEIESESPFVVYPNPTKDRVSFTYDSEDEVEVQVLIYTVEGKQVAKNIQKSSMGNNTLTLDLNHVKAGTYLYEISYGDRKEKGTIIKH